MRHLVFALALVGCHTADPPTPPATPPPEPVPIVAPTAFVRDVSTSEQTASKVQKEVGGGLCRALTGRKADSLALQLQPDFAGTPPGAGTLTHAGEPTVRTYAGTGAVDRDAWAAAMVQHAAAYTAITRCKVKPFRFRIHEADPKRAWAVMHFDLDGRGADGAALTDRGDLELEVTKTGDTWRMAKARFTALQRVETRVPTMTDVSAATGVGYLRDDQTARLVEHEVNNRNVETIGGLAVVDENGDERPDILAWNDRRNLDLFRNDGNGGFLRFPDLIPARAVGMFNLFVDLDGDGREEIVSSSAVCMDGVPQLPLYVREGTRFVPAPDRLLLPMRCAAANEYVYQHIAVDDVDGDGDLDLFVSAYEARSADTEFNKFYSEDGAENLLFLNQGGLRFVEAAKARGITGRRATYVATFFDYDGDGDRDLYVVNDFAPNELFLAQGGGFFERAEDPHLTENGQSMGVTVSDFDGDLDLDLYVSNMYSSAGHRIAPLVADQLAPETAHSLERLAEGNALYSREGPGKYGETAAALHIAHSGWAWGQAWFDADNDGDRDLYVVNGMTSHSEIREHDF